MTSLLTLLALGIGVAGVAAWVMNVADSAPNINQLKPRDPGQLSEVYASDGSLLGYITSDVLRTYASGKTIPRVLKRATVAIEDRRYYQHGGIDYEGIVRAAMKDVFGGGKSIQGGSTLTMQLVRNIYLPYRLADTRSLQRKIIEAKLAQELEKKHSKNWILTAYLNDVDYGTLGGKTAVGVGAASQMFFNKPVNKLNLAQAALLAGLPQAPSEYNPFLAPDLARGRRHEVLQAMVQSHYITQAQATAADHSSLQVTRNNAYGLKREPYVFDYVRDQLIKQYGLRTVERGGLKVYTTIDLKRQQQARQAILANEGQPGDPAAALVSIDPTNGHILAMATSSSYDQTKFDYAAQAHRQTGSAFKVFALMTLIHDYHGDPNQTYYTSKELTPGWLPAYPTYHVQTSELSYQGNINITRATTRVRQHRVRPARPGRGHGQGHRHRTRDGHHLATDELPVRGARRRRRLAAGDGRRVRDAGQRRHPPPGDSDQPRRLLRQERLQPRRLTRQPGVHHWRGVRRHAGAQDRHPERHRDRRRLRLPRGRQDRHHQQLHRRVLRRLHAAARDRRLGRLPELDDLHERCQRTRPGVRRNPVRADLA